MSSPLRLPLARCLPDRFSCAHIQRHYLVVLHRLSCLVEIEFSHEFLAFEHQGHPYRVVGPHLAVWDGCEVKPLGLGLLGADGLALELCGLEHMDHPVGLLLLAEVESDSAAVLRIQGHHARLLHELADSSRVRGFAVFYLAAGPVEQPLAKALLLPDEKYLSLGDDVAERALDHASSFD